MSRTGARTSAGCRSVGVNGDRDRLEDRADVSLLGGSYEIKRSAPPSDCHCNGGTYEEQRSARQERRSRSQSRQEGQGKFRLERRLEEVSGDIKLGSPSSV